MDMARHVPGAEDLPSLALVTVGAQISQETRPGMTKHHEEAQHSLVEIDTDQAKVCSRHINPQGYGAAVDSERLHKSDYHLL